METMKSALGISDKSDNASSPLEPKTLEKQDIGNARKVQSSLK
jgi:hypothetical protein